MTRICKKCGQELPATEEFFVKNKICAGGIEYTCKVCRKEYLATRYALDKERITHIQKVYREKNKDKVREANKNWRELNSDKMVKYKKDYVERNPDRRRESVKKWDKNNKDKKLANTRKRRAVLYGLNEHHTLEDINSLYEKQQGLCYYCGCDISSGYHIEHKTPLSRGGSDTKENLCLSCSDCNYAKWIRTEEEFLRMVAA